MQFEQYRISRIFINRTEAVVNRGLQLKHIPTGEVSVWCVCDLRFRGHHDDHFGCVRIVQFSHFFSCLKEREVMHLQYVDWPDHGIPDDPQPFLSKTAVALATVTTVSIT